MRICNNAAENVLNPVLQLDVRPITILSRLYRQWARYKSISILVQLSQRIPNLIGGGTKNMSALLLSAHFQETLDDHPQQNICGLTVDILKAYNCVPRYPLIIFMAKMGWPTQIIGTYLSALVHLSVPFWSLVIVQNGINHTRAFQKAALWQ